MWQAYQRPKQIKLEKVVSLIRPSGGGERVGKRLIQKIRKNEEFLTYEKVIGSKWNLIFRRISCLRALILNIERIRWHWGGGGFGGGNLKFWKRLDWGIGMKLGGKKTSPWYVIDITRTDPLSLGDLEGEGWWGICNLRSGDQILMKFDI